LGALEISKAGFKFLELLLDFVYIMASRVVIVSVIHELWFLLATSLLCPRT
jgi:hypothetical protein